MAVGIFSSTTSRMDTWLCSLVSRSCETWRFSSSTFSVSSFTSMILPIMPATWGCSSLLQSVRAMVLNQRRSSAAFSRHTYSTVGLPGVDAQKAVLLPSKSSGVMSARSSALS